MAAFGGPSTNTVILRDLFNDILYWYDLSLPTSTIDTPDYNTIDTGSGYNSFSRLYDLSGNGFHLKQSNKSSQPIVNENIYTSIDKNLTRSITSASYASGETSQRSMHSDTSNSEKLIFGSWTFYIVYQFDGHFNYVPLNGVTGSYDPNLSSNTRFLIFSPLGNIDDNNQWETFQGAGSIFHWRNANSTPNGGGPLTFRGYAYGNYRNTEQFTGITFDISGIPRDRIYTESIYGLPPGRGNNYYDSTRELTILNAQVEQGIAARLWENHNFRFNQDTTIEDVLTITNRFPSSLYGGRVAEVLMFTKAHTTEERLTINKLLANKWRVNLTL